MIVTLDDAERKYVIKFQYEGKKTSCFIKKIIDGVDHKTWPVLREGSVVCYQGDHQERAVGRTLAFAKAIGNIVVSGIIVAPIEGVDDPVKLDDVVVDHKIRQAFWKAYKEHCTAKFLKYAPHVN